MCSYGDFCSFSHKSISNDVGQKDLACFHVCSVGLRSGLRTNILYSSTPAKANHDSLCWLLSIGKSPCAAAYKETLDNYNVYKKSTNPCCW